MDRVSLFRRVDRAEAVPVAGGWQLDAERESVVEGPVEVVDELAVALGSVAHRVSSGVLILKFGNAVGRYVAGPFGTLHVHSGKWTEAHYGAMLSDIAEWSAALPFHAGAPSALPYSRAELEAPDVLYHAFVWLRHVLLEQPEAPLLGGLRSIVRDPHRLMQTHERVVPSSLASRLSPRALEEVAYGLRPLQRVGKGRGLRGGSLFPAEISERVSRPTADTAENRFVKAFLDSCGHVVEAMRARMEGGNPRLAHQVRADCINIEGELAPVRRHRMWQDVGRMLHFPASSMVLQRRPAYREVLRNHILMRMASKALPLDQSQVLQLLEIKDIARLYELWTAFAVIDAVRALKGAPVEVRDIEDDKLRARLKSGIVACWDDGTEVAYNASFTTTSGFHGRSWSLELRPDVCVWVPRGPTRGLHLLDAKFKLVGRKKGGQRDGWAAKKADLHKMHTYRDAIPQARSAWVMYPGTEYRDWRRDASEPDGIDGVGAVPVVPGEQHVDLCRLISRMLGHANLLGPNS